MARADHPPIQFWRKYVEEEEEEEKRERSA